MKGTYESKTHFVNKFVIMSSNYFLLLFDIPSTTTMTNYVCLWYFKEMLKFKDNYDEIQILKSRTFGRGR